MMKREWVTTLAKGQELSYGHSGIKEILMGVAMSTIQHEIEKLSQKHS
jgi:hypothetical protein